MTIQFKINGIILLVGCALGITAGILLLPVFFSSAVKKQLGR